jgi:putative DNA primase/helicase
VPEFEPELLPSVLSVSALEIAKSKQAPIDFVAVTYMVALSSLLARHVAIRPMAENEWTVVPNVWGLIVGRPSAKKTPAMTAALKPLDILEDAAAEAYELALRDFDLRVQLHTHQVGANKSNIQKLLRSADPAQKSEAAMLIEEQQDMEPEQPGCTRYIANDSTVEKLADLLQANPAILVCRDELQGFFASLERNGQESARAFYLEAWTGDKSFKVDRIGRGSTRVPRACVSVLGGIQPGPIGSLMREAQRYGRANDGLMQRFQLAVWPDLSPTFELVDTQPDREIRGQIMALFDRFSTFDPKSVEAATPEHGMPYLRFADDAQDLFLRWLEKHENRQRQDEMAECMEAHLGKYPSLVPSIALILHLAENKAGPVGIESVTRAIAWATYLEAHAKRIYAPIVGADFVSARALAKKIESGKLPEEFSLRDVYRKGWANLSTADDARVAAEVLEDFDWIVRRHHETAGRTAVIYEVNPLVLEPEQ